MHEGNKSAFQLRVLWTYSQTSFQGKFWTTITPSSNFASMQSGRTNCRAHKPQTSIIRLLENIHNICDWNYLMTISLAEVASRYPLVLVGF